MSKYLLICLTLFISSVLVTGIAIAGNGHDYQKSITGSPANDNPVILDSGGPDFYGYYYYDSDDWAYNAPVFDWIDISGIGTDLEIDEDNVNVGPFSIGFTFNLYGVDFISFRVSSNGFISFSSTYASSLNQPIPTTNEPNDLLAVFWDDLHPQTGGQAYYYSNNVDTLIVAWHNFERNTGEGEYSFEAVITADGNILFQYLSLSGILDSHTIGIENQHGNVGLQYVFNDHRNESGTAILFSQTPPDHGEKNILVIASDSASIFVAELAAYEDIGEVDYFEAINNTPSLSLLQEYDCVVVWSNYVFDDPITMGDVIADYVDVDGAVVVLPFAFSTSWNMAGRFMSDYCPFVIGYTSYTYKALADYDVGHQLMQGVDSLREYFSANVTLQNSPMLVASYEDSTPLVAYNTENNVVAVNCYVGNNRDFTGDVINLVHNAVIFSCDGPGEILLIHADYGAAVAKRELLGMPGMSGIHQYNVRHTNPTLDFLNLYDVVVVWSNYPFYNAQVLGNRLADFVDFGGGVILQQFCFYTGNNNGMEGRLMSSYSPYGAGNAIFGYRNMGWYNPDHPLMQGVDHVREYYLTDVTVENDAVSVASWDDSTPFVAYNPDHDVVGIHGYIGDAPAFEGDMMLVTYNAIRLLRGMSDIDEVSGLPNKFNLTQNYPNPFNANTTIRFNLPRQAEVTLDIYNILGQRVSSIDNGKLTAGTHTITFDASEISSGVYFYKLTAGELTETRKMTLIK